MTVAHVEALRLENHFMRQSLVEKKSDEKEVVEMQKKYHQVLDLTEVIYEKFWLNYSLPRQIFKGFLRFLTFQKKLKSSN